MSLSGKEQGETAVFAGYFIKSCTTCIKINPSPITQDIIIMQILLACLVFGDIFISLLFSFVCDCLFELCIKKERGCLLVKMLYLLSKGSVDFLEPNTSPNQP